VGGGGEERGGRGERKRKREGRERERRKESGGGAGGVGGEWEGERVREGAGREGEGERGRERGDMYPTTLGHMSSALRGGLRPILWLPHSYLSTACACIQACQILSHPLHLPSALPRLQVDQERHDTVLETRVLCLNCLCCEPPGPNMMPQGQTTNNQSVSHTCSVQSQSHFVSS
jgi:hypothetical protein